MISEGFNWEEIDVKSNGNSKHQPIFIVIGSKGPKALVLKADLAEKIGIQKGDPYRLYKQGKAIFMLKKERSDKKVSSNGGYFAVGGSDIAKELYSLTDATEFEIVDTEEGCVLFRPRR